jgi:hypothetical protein
MLHNVHRTRRALSAVLWIGAMSTAAFSALACTAKQEPAASNSAATKTASEKAPTAPAKSAVNAAEPAKKPEAASDDSKKLAAAPGEAASKGAAPAVAANAPKKAAESATQEKAKPADAQSPPPAATPKQTPPPPPAPPVKTADGKPAPDAKPVPNPQDPNNTEVDPNSKAKLTYEFGSDTKNFGKVMQGDVLNHTFVVQSSGEEDLVIKQAKPTCGCTVAQLMVQQPDGTMVPYQFGSPVPPGKRVEIAATLHTQNKRGHASSRINVFSNDPRGQSQFGLEAEVDPFFQVNPASINFNTLSAKDTATDKASISTTRGEKVKLSAVKDNMPQGMKVDLKALDADAEGKASKWELVSAVGPGLAEGNLAYAVPLKSDLPIPGGEKLPNGTMPTYEVSLTIMGRVTGMISFAPQFVSLGLIRPGQVLSRTVRITSHDPEFKLTEPKVTVQGRDTAEWEYAKDFKVVTRPAQSDKAGETAVDVELILNGMPESLNGSFNGILVIQVGHPEKPEIRLPITGVCRGGPAPTPAGGDAGPK